jgi:proline racemase
MSFDWEPPAGWRRWQTIDAHTAGEPLRIIHAGIDPIPGDTILAKRAYAQANLDHLRRVLMFEPRGHADMYGAILTEPVTADGDVGVLFLHNEGWSTMCGHGIIALTKVGLETGLIQPRGEAETIRFDTPAGRVTARAEREGERVARARFRNVPSFVLRRDAHVEVPGLGDVRYDLAFGGAFYAYVEAADVGLTIEPAHFREIIEVGMRIKHAVMAGPPFQHPTGGADLNFLYGTILVGPPATGAHSRNVCVFAEGEVDRSPTGTGVSGRAAIHHLRGELDLGESITIESILGTSFDVSAIEETEVGGFPAIVPEVSGCASITGRHEFLLGPDDELADGFILR